MPLTFRPWPTVPTTAWEGTAGCEVVVTSARASGGHVPIGKNLRVRATGGEADAVEYRVHLGDYHQRKVHEDSCGAWTLSPAR